MFSQATAVIAWRLVLLAIQACAGAFGLPARRHSAEEPLRRLQPVAQGIAPLSRRPPAEWASADRSSRSGRTAFRAEHVTEGKIAVDEDRSTPVFSPYAGRVTQAAGASRATRRQAASRCS